MKWFGRLIMSALFLPEDEPRVVRVQVQAERAFPNARYLCVRVLSTDRWAWLSVVTEDGDPVSLDVRNVEGAHLALSAAVRAAGLVRSSSMAPPPPAPEAPAEPA